MKVDKDKNILLILSIFIVSGIGILLYFASQQPVSDNETEGQGEEPVYTAETLQEGYGVIAVKPGDKIAVNYMGVLEDNTLFDNSLTAETPYEVFIGRGEAPLGWDEGLIGMKIGEKRRIVVPANYSGSGIRGNAPENVTLYYEIELVDIR